MKHSVFDYHKRREQGNDYYTYTLAYPLSMGGAIFYVGKGKNGRIDAHEHEAKRGHQCQKCVIIRAIQAQGEHVVKEKVKENLDWRQALVAEREIANKYKNLVNEKPLLSTHSAIRYLPKTLALSVEIRNQIVPFIEERMKEDGIAISSESCKEYLRSICEQSLINRLIPANTLRAYGYTVEMRGQEIEGADEIYRRSS